MIEMHHISKTFRVARRNAGMREAVKALFRREYTEIKALNDVSFTIGDGEMVGYIGPNGAGKSSTIKIMSGILHPDMEEGTCVIDGRIPWKQRKEHVRNIGVVFGQRSQLWWDVPVLDSYELIRDIYQVDEAVYKRNLNELTECLQLSEILRTPVRQLSLGQRMRCEIGASLLHDPRILFLDEPTIGLDAVSKIAVRDFIKRRNREHGTTVILTTHDMQDIEALTERILLIGKGRILLDGSLTELKSRHSGVRKITVSHDGGNTDRQEESLPEGIVCTENQPGQVAFAVDTTRIGVSEAIGVLSGRFAITDLSVAGATAEELVVSLYEEFAI
ncbi:MAG: ATP-binding cassette domain-containing protein [Clostridia bacterium]|nr:ATP-binding cassette domain-containing protein [Clostridia bacterium]